MLKVEGRDIADGITLTQHYLSETSRLVSAANVSAEIDKAEALRRWLLEQWADADVMVRDVV